MPKDCDINIEVYHRTFYTRDSAEEAAVAIRDRFDDRFILFSERIDKLLICAVLESDAEQFEAFWREL